MTNTARKGRRGEHRARRILEAAGYTVIRAAASKGPFDLLALDALSIRCIAVKVNGYLSAVEREQLTLVPLPSNATREVWRFIDGHATPVVERL